MENWKRWKAVVLGLLALPLVLTTGEVRGGGSQDGPKGERQEQRRAIQEKFAAKRKALMEECHAKRKALHNEWEAQRKDRVSARPNS